MKNLIEAQSNSDVREMDKALADLRKAYDIIDDVHAKVKKKKGWGMDADSYMELEQTLDYFESAEESIDQAAKEISAQKMVLTGKRRSR
jgi:hypothetical protein